MELAEKYNEEKNRAEAGNRAKSDFLANISHELRTPITVVKGSAELLAKIPNQHPVAVNAVKRLQQASDEMQVLTETFLLLGKESISPRYFADVDLAEALQTSKIAAALLDVLSQEPPSSTNVLLGAKNSFITPHQAWASQESRERLLQGIVKNIQDFISN